MRHACDASFLASRRWLTRGAQARCRWRATKRSRLGSCRCFLDLSWPIRHRDGPLPHSGSG
jgi:hypothetical protein